MTLATTGPEGPWASAVYYVSEGFRLFFLSAGNTRHGKNLDVSPNAAAAIHDDPEDWREIRGIQLEGSVQKLRGEARRAAIDLYRVRFPFIDGGVPSLEAALATDQCYCLVAESLFFIDNTRGLGWRRKIPL